MSGGGGRRVHHIHRSPLVRNPAVDFSRDQAQLPAEKNLSCGKFSSLAAPSLPPEKALLCSSRFREKKFSQTAVFSADNGRYHTGYIRRAGGSRCPCVARPVSFSRPPIGRMWQPLRKTMFKIAHKLILKIPYQVG